MSRLAEMTQFGLPGETDLTRPEGELSFDRWQQFTNTVAREFDGTWAKNNLTQQPYSTRLRKDSRV